MVTTIQNKLNDSYFLITQVFQNGVNRNVVLQYSQLANELTPQIISEYCDCKIEQIKKLTTVRGYGISNYTQNQHSNSNKINQLINFEIENGKVYNDTINCIAIVQGIAFDKLFIDAFEIKHLNEINEFVSGITSTAQILRIFFTDIIQINYNGN